MVKYITSAHQCFLSKKNIYNRVLCLFFKKIFVCTVKVKKKNKYFIIIEKEWGMSIVRDTAS